MSFEHKVALISGAGAGLGKSTAERFAAKGASVVLTDPDPAAAQATAALIKETGGEAVWVDYDASNPAHVEPMLLEAERAFGELHFAVNNLVTEPMYCLLHEIDEAGWSRMVDRTLKCVWLGMKYQIPAIKRSGGGAIVNVASSMGINSAPGLSVFGAAKAAVISLTRSAAAEVATDDIRINCITPGGVASKGMTALCETEPDLKTTLGAAQAMGRLAEPEEIANCIYFMCSDKASFMTGENMVVDGGGGVMARI